VNADQGTSRPRWVAIGVATVLVLASFSALLAGLVEDSAVEVNRAAAFGVGLALVPFVFVVLAFTSRHPHAPSAVLKSLAVWPLVALGLALVSIVLALNLAFGIAGIFSLAAGPRARYPVRAGFVGLAAVYTTMLLVFVPAIGLMTAGAIPLVALGFADEFSNRRSV